jgi:hypothetical protein
LSAELSTQELEFAETLRKSLPDVAAQSAIEVASVPDLGVVNLVQQCARIVGPAELVAE